MTNTEIGLTLKLISLALFDKWLEFNTKVASSKGNRPVWKITEVGEGENKQVFVDDFQGLLAYQKELDKLAKMFLSETAPTLPPLPEFPTE